MCIARLQVHRITKNQAKGKHSVGLYYKVDLSSSLPGIVIVYTQIRARRNAKKEGQPWTA